jgi:hypothetical protein
LTTSRAPANRADERLFLGPVNNPGGAAIWSPPIRIMRHPVSYHALTVPAAWRQCLMSVASAEIMIGNRTAPATGAAVPLAPAIERALFWLMLAATILPVWTTTYFPSQDGPIHLFIVHLLDSYLKGTIGLAGDYFELNPIFEPNLAFYGIGVALAQVTDLLTVEKLYVSGMALALCLAVRHAVRAINPNAVVYSLLVAPTAFHYFVHMGFYNYSLSIAAAVLAITVFLRRLDDLGPRNLAIMAGLALLTVSIHLMAFMVLGLGVGLAVGWRALCDLQAGRRFGEVVLATIDRGWRLGLAMAPALLVALAFFLRHGVSRARADDIGGEGLASMITLISYDMLELWLMLPWLAAFYGLVVYTLYRHLKGGTLWHSALWALLPLLLVIVFFLNPISTRRVALADRFIPFIVCFTIIWFATLTPSRLVARLVAALAIVSTLAMTGYRLWIYNHYDDEIERYLAVAEAMEDQRTVLPLHLRRDPGTREHAVMPLVHAGAHLGRQRDVLYMRGSLLSTGVYGYFPVVYKEAVDPFRHIGRQLDASPPDIDILSYGETTDGQLDYIMLWPAPTAALDDPITEELRGQLAAGWERLPVPPNASVELYRRLVGPRLAATR